MEMESSHIQVTLTDQVGVCATNGCASQLSHGSNQICNPLKSSIHQVHSKNTETKKVSLIEASDVLNGKLKHQIDKASIVPKSKFTAFRWVAI